MGINIKEETTMKDLVELVGRKNAITILCIALVICGFILGLILKPIPIIP